MSEASKRPVVALLLPYGLDLRRWRSRHSAGEVLDETPYGYGRAAADFELRWSVDHREAVIARFVRRAVVRSTGIDLVHVWRNRRLLDGCDVVWTHTEHEHLAVGLLRGRRAFGLLAQSVWLWDDWPRRTPLYRFVVRRILRRVDLELVHSRLNLASAAAVVPGRDVALAPFGTAAPMPQAGSPDRRVDRFVFAPGNDRDRDWPTLLAAAVRLPDVRFLIASSSPFFGAGRRLPANVEQVSRLDAGALGDAYSRAAAVVVPLRPNMHASGATVAIEAMSEGCAVIASDTGGLDEYLAESVHELVPPRDTDALTAAIARFTASPAPAEANRSVPALRGLRQADYVARYVLATEALLGGPWDPRIDRFVPVDE